MDVCHNSHDLNYRAPFGAVPTGTEVVLRLDAPVPSCDLILQREGAAAERRPMARDGAGRYSVTLRVPASGTLLWYYFELRAADGHVTFYGNNDRQVGGPGILTDRTPLPYQITVYEPGHVPAWFTDAVVYQIFPDRFRRGRDWLQRCRDARRPEGWRGPRRVFQEDWDDSPFYSKNPAGEVTRWPFFGGTLEGIREKLLYLKSLGVGAVYLNPIFLASSNHKYDTADYTKIDPGFGDEESFRRLAESARTLGIRLILDGVFAHTGADSVYFNRYGNYENLGAYQGPASDYDGWYRFESFPDRYDSWWGVSDLPKTDKNNGAYREFIYGGQDGVVRRWLRLGAHGWRLDVADELPDNFICGVRQAISETDPDAILLGEVWEDASSKISYGVRRTYLLGGALQSVTNYPFRASALDYMLGKTTAFELADALMSIKENYPPESSAMALNVIGSHDRARALTLLGDPPPDLGEGGKEFFRLSPEKYGMAIRRLKLLSLLQYTVLGVPCVYYGDEAGLQGFEDPYNRAPFPWGREQADLQEHYRLLGLLRQQHPALRSGDYMTEGLTEHVLAVSRKTADETLLLIVNRGIFETETVTVSTGAGFILDLLSAEELSPAEGRLKLTLPPLAARLLCLRDAPIAKPLGDSFDVSRDFSQVSRDFSQVSYRAAGILCALSSVPASRESGSTLEDVARFIDFLAASGQKLWQLLPLNPAGKGSSPFYSPSLFALGGTVPSDPEDDGGDDYLQFCAENAYWLDDDALYLALKSKNGGTPWQEWPEDERRRSDLQKLRQTHRDAMESNKRAQFRRHRAWLQIKKYAGRRGVRIIGDLPIYAAPDSADVWARQELFRLDSSGLPALHAGVPPDYFSPDGQDWGNPLYDWDNAADALYRFWEMRFRRALQLYDIVRLDHFRSFSAYFAIPGGMKASDGHWLAGPGPGFFRDMRARLGYLPVIAEDLGVQDVPVHNLLKLTGLPGMLVWQFCAGEYDGLTAAETSRRVLYSGTHDNQTLAGWCAAEFGGGDAAAKAGEILEKLYSLGTPWVIAPLQDVLGLGDEARMNVPGTASGNWTWRADAALLTDSVAAELGRLTALYGR